MARILDLDPCNRVLTAAVWLACRSDANRFSVGVPFWRLIEHRRQPLALTIDGSGE